MTGFRSFRWTAVFLSGLACAAGAGPDAVLDEDLAFIEETVAGRLGMTRLAKQAVEAVRRRRPGESSRLDLAETRLMSREALAETDPARREMILAEVRSRLARLKEAGSASGTVSTAGAEAALALARLAADVAEASRSPEGFAGAAKDLSDLLHELDRLVERAAAAREARQIDEAAFGALDQKLYVLQAEVRYEHADVHLRWGRALAAGDPKRAEVLEKAAEEFDNAALFTEDDAKPDMIFYPQPYLKKAACERALGDLPRARETLTRFLARKIQHPDGPNARSLARQQVADMFLAEKDWDGARKAAADLAREGQADLAALFSARVAVEQGRESGDAAAKKAADEGFARLEQLSARRGPAAQEAADWLRRYREGSEGEPVSAAAAGFLERAAQMLDQKNHSGALRLYQEFLGQADPAAWRAGAVRAWFGIAICHYQAENHLAASAAFAQAAEYPGADEKTAVNAAAGVESSLLKWGGSLAQGDALMSMVRRHTRRMKESVAARFPGSAGVQRYHAELGDVALADGDAARALESYRQVSDIEPRWKLAALEGIVEAERARLAGLLKAAGSRFPTAEEAGPLDAALGALVSWAGGPGAKTLDAAARQGAHRRAVSQAAFHLALALPARALAAMDAFAKAFPEATPPPEWGLVRCIAKARQGDLPDARADWSAIRRDLGAKPPPKPMLAAANVLGRAASEAVRAARAAGNDAVAREGALWVTELLTFTLEVKENPSDAEVAELVNRFEWQVAKTGDHMTAIGIGEFLLERADAWKLSEERRLRVLTGLSDAYWAVEDWSQAMRASRELDAAYEKKGRLAKWARKRVVESARKVAERTPDPAARNKACLEWYEAAKQLRGVLPDQSADWWDCSYEMGLVPVLQGEPGLLRDYLANLFGIAPDLGGDAMRPKFADLAVWAWRRGDEKQRPFAAQLLADMWARAASWKDPAAAGFIR